MPHVDIKCFPRELTDEQKTALAADITEVLIRHRGLTRAQAWREGAERLAHVGLKTPSAMMQRMPQAPAGAGTQ